MLDKSYFTNDLLSSLTTLEALEEFLSELSKKDFKEKYGFNNQDLAYLYHKATAGYFNLKCYSKALETEQIALRMFEEELGESNETVYSVCHNVGSIFQNLGELEKAMEHYKRALEILQGTLPEEHDPESLSEIKKEEFAYFYRSIAIIHDLQNEDIEALKYYYKALEYAKLTTNSDSLEAIYANLNSNYEKLGLEIMADDWAREFIDRDSVPNSAYIIERIFDPNALKLEIRLKDLLNNLYYAFARGEKDYVDFLEGSNLQTELGRNAPSEEIEEAKLLLFKYTMISIIHHGPEEIDKEEKIKALAREHKDLIIKAAYKHPDYFIYEPILFGISVAYPDDEKYQEALRTALSKNYREYLAEKLACKTEANSNEFKRSEDDDGDNSGSGCGDKLNNSANKATEMYTPNSDSASNEPKPAKSVNTETNKEAMLNIIEHINERGNIIDQKLIAQLEHFGRTGIALETLANYVQQPIEEQARDIYQFPDEQQNATTQNPCIQEAETIPSSDSAHMEYLITY